LIFPANAYAKIDFLKALKDNTDTYTSMDTIIKNIINENINDCKLCYTDNTEIENVKYELFTNCKHYEIDRTLIYDKLGEIFEYAEKYNMNDTVIEKIKKEDYSYLFSLYALSVFDEYVIDIIKDKYKYNNYYITDRHNEIAELTINEIIELYKANSIKDELIKFINDWKQCGYKVSNDNLMKLKWGTVMKLINSIDCVVY
jgi:hypothetical protein